MHNLSEFLQKYHHWFIFLLLEVVSMVLLFQFNGYQGSVWFTSANAVSGKVYEANAAVNQFFSLAKVNEQLTQRNVFLEQRIQQLSEQLEKATGDTTIASKPIMTAIAGNRIIPARVISNSIDKQDNFITLDKGAADGIKPDMGVVGGTGIVGIVYQTSRNYSIVIPVLSSHSRISCTIQGRGYFGYLHWDGKSPRHAYVDDIPRHAHFRLYDKIVTSGYSSVFPPGILIGKIIHVYNSPDGLSYRCMVELSTDFGNLRNVCVVDDKIMRERLEVQRAAEDSIKNKKE
ncbi:rod shape-determining protein MreC [Prevotella sp. PINT]|jgi:Cell shape-determining protein|uniref:rod shape-determining protein MreC n=1 Tax=Palleniella intestinalis TaxID=2736291 RepID=UPI001551B89C|nr:rod shape-determining protein MreC [Palleniella intestinalis]NPD82910.1 rod shape-determining protein MreC [Palleniella intestinalis]